MNKKIIRIDKRADKEIKKFPEAVQDEINIFLKTLANKGTLSVPDGKKINEELFEIRIKLNGQWRVLYAYCLENIILILSAFHKKTRQTPIREIKRARKRLKEYRNTYEQTV